MFKSVSECNFSWFCFYIERPKLVYKLFCIALAAQKAKVAQAI